MRTLTRYILRELGPPTLIGFVFYTFIILMNQLFNFAELIIKRSLHASVVLELLALTLPHIIVLTIPMALLVGILIAVGRLSADSEVIAMQAAGVSPGAIYRPVFYFSVLAFLLNFALMTWALPWGNSRLQARRVELLTSAAETQIKPRVFFDQFVNRVIYIDDIDPGSGLWKGVFISDASDANQQRVIVAGDGRLSVTAERQVWLELQNSATHVTTAGKADRYELNRNAAQRILLDDPRREAVQDQPLAKSLKELSLSELRARLARERAAGDDLDVRFINVEIHSRFSIPFACIAFGIIGLPLGITNRRGGKSSGFSLSIAIILIYYVLLNNGTDLARSGKLPVFLGLWLPNLILVPAGFWLMGKTGVDRGGIFRHLTPLLRRLRRRKGAGTVEEQEETSILQRLDIPFPNIIDRYILTEFLKTLGIVILSTTVVWLIVDYTEIVEEITQNNVSFDVVASYFRYRLLQIFDAVLPISVLISTLITFGVLAKNNEITAIKSNGVSLYRIALPVVAIAIALSVVSYLLLDFVLPYSNQKMAQRRAQIAGKETPSTYSREQQREWVKGRDRYIFNFLGYDSGSMTLSDVQVFELHPTEFRLTRRIRAEEARFDGTGWVFYNGWIRSFGDDGHWSFTPFVRPIRLHYRERPGDFERQSKAPDQMTWSELSSYIASVRRLGYAADELTVQLWRKTSWPFISVVMALIALPFSFRMGKRGAMYGIGIALLLAFVYWSLFGIFTKLGEVGSLPAVLAAWSANILFAIAAVYLFLTVET